MLLLGRLRPVAGVGLLCLVQVDVLLREGDRDALRVKALLDLFLHREENVSVVRSLDPWPYGEVHAALGKLQHIDCRGRLLKNALIRGNDIL